MRASRRAAEFTVVQRESMQVVAVLRRVLFSLRPSGTSSPVAGGSAEPPSPSAGAFRTRYRSWPGWGSQRQFVLPRMGLAPATVGAGKVTDRRNSTLRCYFRYGG
jgi:hypothetical protein